MGFEGAIFWEYDPGGKLLNLDSGRIIMLEVEGSEALTSPSSYYVYRKLQYSAPPVLRPSFESGKALARIAALFNYF